MKALGHVVLSGMFLAVAAFPALVLAQTAINGLVVTPYSPGLPKTGQETCYNNTNSSVTCNATWAQDAYYADPGGSYDYGSTRGEGSWANWNTNGHRFINNTDGTITDQATGLMWVADPTAAGRGGTYTWYNAVIACENLTYAGHDDWRLPNVRELQSIVDYGTSNPSIDTNFFVSQSDFYWSSTTSAGYPTYAWYVSFSSGDVSSFGKTYTDYVRPVRSGQ